MSGDDAFSVLSIGVPARGRTRHAIACVPEGPAPADGWRVVIAFHGGRSHPEAMRRFSGLDEFAAGREAVVLYPAGSGSRAEMLTWNGGNCCGEAWEEEVDDVAFVRDLVARAAGIVPVDPNRVHVTGMSNGAMMAYRTAAEWAEGVASIAPVAGPLALQSIAPKRPVPVLHFHGSLDQFTPLEGGVGRRSVTRTCHRGILDGLREWARANRLDPLPVTTVVPCPDEAMRVERVAWGAPGEAEVVLYRIDGGGHTWPGRTPDSFYLGSATRAFRANPLILDFFRRHPRAG